MRCLILLLAAFLFSPVVFSQSKPDRFALVIGVSDYENTQPLKNSLNDAQDMAKALKSRGFEVIESYNARTKREMEDAIRQYHRKVSEHPSATGLVYYSGHAMQVDGSNYLMPAAANPALKADLGEQTVRMDFLMQVIEESGVSLSIIIMDACRNNPFRSFGRSAEKGLNQVIAPKGSYVVYATAPGSVASDGTGRNGLFTSKLLKYMTTSGASLEQIFKSVGRDVQTESNGAQVPWINSSFTGDFYFTPKDFSEAVEPYNGVEFYEGEKLVGAFSVDYILVRMPEFKQADEKMKKLSSDLEAELKTMYNDYQNKMATYNALPGSTSQQDRKPLEDELTSLQGKITTFQRDAVTTLELNQTRLMEPIFLKLGQTVDDICAQYKYKSVETQNITVRPDAAITRRVLDKLGIKP
ncbi:MAG: caspase family protein [Bacteroidota bacterium]